MLLPMISLSKAFLLVTMAAALEEEKIASIHCMEEDSGHNSLHLLQSKGRFTLSRDASLEPKAKLMKGVSYSPSLHPLKPTIMTTFAMRRSPFGVAAVI